jgi:hypothetical protein
MFGIEASTWIESTGIESAGIESIGIESNAGLRAIRDDEGGGARSSATEASGGEGA